MLGCFRSESHVVIREDQVHKANYLKQHILLQITYVSVIVSIIVLDEEIAIIFIGVVFVVISRRSMIELKLYLRKVWMSLFEIRSPVRAILLKAE